MIYILGLPDFHSEWPGLDRDYVERCAAEMREMAELLTRCGYGCIDPSCLPMNLWGPTGLCVRAAMIQVASSCITLRPGNVFLNTIDGRIAVDLRKTIYHPSDIYSPEGILRSHSPVEYIEGGEQP